MESQQTDSIKHLVVRITVQHFAATNILLPCSNQQFILTKMFSTPSKQHPQNYSSSHCSSQRTSSKKPGRNSRRGSSPREKELQKKIEWMLKCQQHKMDVSSSRNHNPIKYDKEKGRNVQEEIERESFFSSDFLSNQENIMELMNMNSSQQKLKKKNFISKLQAQKINSPDFEPKGKCFKDTKPSSEYKMTIKDYINTTPINENHSNRSGSQNRQILKEIKEIKQMMHQYLDKNERPVFKAKRLFMSEVKSQCKDDHLLAFH